MGTNVKPHPSLTQELRFWRDPVKNHAQISPDLERNPDSDVQGISQKAENLKR